MIKLIEFDQALSLSSGSEIRRRRVSNIHPRSVLTSSIAPSACNLLGDIIPFRGMCSILLMGRQMVCSDRGMAASSLGALPGRSGPTATVSSRYTSHFPLSSLGIDTIVGIAAANGMSSGSRFILGNDCCCGACRTCGFHSLQLSRSVARSATGSDMHPHSLGHGLPPNVSRSDIRSSQMPVKQTCVRDLIAVCKFRCWRL